MTFLAGQIDHHRFEYERHLNAGIAAIANADTLGLGQAQIADLIEGMGRLSDYHLLAAYSMKVDDFEGAQIWMDNALGALDLGEAEVEDHEDLRDCLIIRQAMVEEQRTTPTEEEQLVLEAIAAKLTGRANGAANRILNNSGLVHHYEYFPPSPMIPEKDRSSNDLISPSGSIKWYPNPAKDILTFEAEQGNKGLSVHIFDLMGRSLLSRDISSESYLEVSSLNPGSYILTFTQDNGVIGNGHLQIID